jgi:hypothetical protein
MQIEETQSQLPEGHNGIVTITTTLPQMKAKPLTATADVLPGSCGTFISKHDVLCSEFGLKASGRALGLGLVFVGVCGVRLVWPPQAAKPNEHHHHPHKTTGPNPRPTRMPSNQIQLHKTSCLHINIA